MDDTSKPQDSRTNLDFRQHKLEPIEVIKGCPAFLNNKLSSPGAILPLILNIWYNFKTIISTPQHYILHTNALYSLIVGLPAASIALTRSFFLGVLLISIVISVSVSLLKFIWPLTISGASTRAWQMKKHHQFRLQKLVNLRHNNNLWSSPKTKIVHKNQISYINNLLHVTVK